MSRLCFDCGKAVPEGQSYDYCEEHKEKGEKILKSLGNMKEIVTIEGIKELNRMIKKKEIIPKNSVQLIMDYVQRKEKEYTTLQNYMKTIEKQLKFSKGVLQRIGKYGR